MLHITAAKGLHLKSQQRCPAGIRTWLSADQSSSSTLTQSSFLFDHCLIPEVLNSSPRAPPLCIFCMSLFVNTPDSDNQLVRSALHAWTVFRLTCSLHRVHCSLHPEQGKSAEVYVISEHSFMDLRCATSSRMDECDIIYLCKYIQF